MLVFKLFSKELTLYLNTAGTLSKVFKDEYKSDISYLKSSLAFDVPIHQELSWQLITMLDYS